MIKKALARMPELYHPYIFSRLLRIFLMVPKP